MLVCHRIYWRGTHWAAMTRKMERVVIENADGEEKDGTITEDDRKRTKDEIDRLTKEHEGKVQEAVDRKTKEVMEV